MKIGVISDTHIPANAEEIPRKILEHFKETELILHAGDLVEPYVLETLRKITEVKAVFGNMDSPQVRKLVPHKELIQIKNFKIGLVHGWGSPEQLREVVREEFEDVDAIVYGHAHSPLNQLFEGVLFFNPGSPTDKVFAPYNSYGILEINDSIKGEIIRL